MHPVEVLVNMNVAIPELIPVAMPPEVMLATAGFVDDHVPPEDGISVVVFPIHIGLGPVMLTTGLDKTVMALLSVA